MLDLKEKVVWVTGASSGIGRALSLELAKRGARLALTARNSAALEALKTDIENSGGTALALPGDVTSLEQLKQAAAAVEAELGPIDLAIANAGTHVFSVPEKFDSAEYMNLMKINFGGMLHTIEAALAQMLQRGRGHLVAVASLAGYRGLPRAAAYGASKAAMIHFLESLRFHMKKQGISVITVNPGFVKTPLTDKNDFHMPFLTDVDKAAKIICNGLEKEKREISFPIPFNWLLKFARILPYPIYEFIIQRLWR